MVMKGESLTIWLFCHLSLKLIVWRCWRVTPWQYPLTRLSTTGNSFQHFQHVLCHPDPKDHVDHICYRRVSNNICPTIFVHKYLLCRVSNSTMSKTSVENAHHSTSLLSQVFNHLVLLSSRDLKICCKLTNIHCSVYCTLYIACIIQPDPIK